MYLTSLYHNYVAYISDFGVQPKYCSHPSLQIAPYRLLHALWRVSHFDLIIEQGHIPPPPHSPTFPFSLDHSLSRFTFNPSLPLSLTGEGDVESLQGNGEVGDESELGLKVAIETGIDRGRTLGASEAS